MKCQPKRSNRHPHGGSNTADFALGMAALFIFILLPCIDLISVGVGYCMCMVLNYNQLHEASLIPSADARDPGGVVCKGIPDQWLNGMGRFVKLSGQPRTVVGYRDGAASPDGSSTDKIVSVATTIICNPFLPIPLPVANVPGLNGPVTFTVVSERPMENPDYAGP